MSNTIQMPLWMIIGQWSLLLALGFLIIIAYRQLGYLLNLKEAISNAGTEKDGLPLGVPAPSFSYTSLKTSKGASKYFVSQGSWSLLLIADPECVSCRNALAALIKLEPRLKNRLRMLVITTSDPAYVEAISEFYSSPIEVGHVEREVIHKLLRTSTTPFLYIIDEKGVIRAKRVVDNENGIRKAIREADPVGTGQFVAVQPTR